MNNILSIKSYSRLELTFTDGLMDKQTLLFNSIDISQNTAPTYNYIITLEYIFRTPKDVFHTDVANMERYVTMLGELVNARSARVDFPRYKAHTKIEVLNVAYTLNGVFASKFKITDETAELSLHVDHIGRE